MSSFGHPRSFAESFGKIHRTADTDLQNRMKPNGKRKEVGSKTKDDLYSSFCTDLAYAVRDLLVTEFRLQNIDAKALAIRLYDLYKTEPSGEKLRDVEKCRQEVSAILNLTKLG